MIIRELTRQASLDLLTRARLGRLACARADQPYVFPISFAYHENSLYCVSTIGQKIEWMRENPLVAVAVDEIHGEQQWESVIVSGRYEEFADTPQTWDMRQLAWSLLKKHELWWEPALAETVLGDAKRPMMPLYFRIHVGMISGRRAANE